MRVIHSFIQSVMLIQQLLTHYLYVPCPVLGTSHNLFNSHRFPVQRGSFAEWVMDPFLLYLALLGLDMLDSLACIVACPSV